MNQTQTSNSLIIHGCGGHARSVADVALFNGITQLVFVDQNAKPNEKLFEFDVLATLDNANDMPHIVAMGDNHAREKVYNSLLKNHINITSLVARDAYLGQRSQLKLGVFVAHKAYIGPMAMIEENTIINTNCIVEHECSIGRHSHISINAVIAGKCQIGNYVLIGAGATVIDNISICSNVIVGAGSVVVKDITEPGVYVGVPAKKVQS